MSEEPAAPLVTVVVTTRNRKDELRACLDSIARQDYPAEVIVVDDASEDGTAETVAADYPDAVLIRHAEPRGYICGRNEAAREATGAIIVSIDDDAVFSTGRILRDTVAAFSDRVGAVAIPYVDVNRGSGVRQLAPDSVGVYLVNAFIGTAHAVRRDVFLALGGYREQLFHQGEESDFCIRMLAAGYVVRAGTGDPIHHFESSRRDFDRMDLYGPRNALLFVYQNVPLPSAIWRLASTVAGVLAWTADPTRLVTRLRGLAAAARAMPTCTRAPVPGPVHSLWRRLQAAEPPLTLPAIAAQLPALRS